MWGCSFPECAGGVWGRPLGQDQGKPSLGRAQRVAGRWWLWLRGSSLGSGTQKRFLNILPRYPSKLLSTALRESFKEIDIFHRNTLGTLILSAVLSTVQRKAVSSLPCVQKPHWGVLGEEVWADGAQRCDCLGCRHCGVSRQIYRTIFKTFSLSVENLIQSW